VHTSRTCQHLCLQWDLRCLHKHTKHDTNTRNMTQTQNMTQTHKHGTAAPSSESLFYARANTSASHTVPKSHASLSACSGISRVCTNTRNMTHHSPPLYNCTYLGSTIMYTNTQFITVRAANFCGWHCTHCTNVHLCKVLAIPTFDLWTDVHLCKVLAIPTFAPAPTSTHAIVCVRCSFARSQSILALPKRTGPNCSVHTRTFETQDQLVTVAKARIAERKGSISEGVSGILSTSLHHLC